MKQARLELLTPDLDRSVTFFPGYDLAQRTTGEHSPVLISAIALALHELTAQPSVSPAAWKLTQSDLSFEGAPR